MLERISDDDMKERSIKFLYIFFFYLLPGLISNRKLVQSAKS
ncbi:MAG: hypothetical protein OP8BY_1185 [Candidatus Saccharicenans subterraneus]|uniref:Uncharacterized protein n=1 Tax=Candidatus Saccharicenans subterraneus TaxID=2508984 RepID=A0A3E2BJS3_9BACT|nr:MAG: hypothetical protein OP8BY_1185 [Candidatus Saccharicenans subterraneum]